MNVRKKAIALILVAAMVLGIVPFSSAVACASDTTVKKIELGTSGVLDKENYKDKDFIYFGNYNGTDTKWRVLDAVKDNTGADNGMFLLSEYLLEQKNKPFDGDSNVWQGSDAQTWCTQFVESSAFTDAERNSMKEITKTEDTGDYLYNITWGTNELNNEKVFYLSAKEAADKIGSKDYSQGLAAKTSDNAAGGWWLRSPHFTTTNRAGCVYESGLVSSNYVSYTSPGVRPAFNLNLNSVLFSSAAVGGKSSGAVGVAALNSVSEYTSDTAKEWKVTLLDTERTFDAQAANGATLTKDAGYSNWSVDITYSNAKTDTNEYVSAMLCDADDNVLYYGNIANGSASGAQSVNIPAGLAIGNYKLKVFSEQLNGNTKTDYASEFKEIPLTVTYPKVATPTATFTATSHNSGTLTGVTTDMMYSIDGGKTWEAVTSTTMNISGITAENGIKVYAKGDEVTTSDSDIQTITITQASAPNGLYGTDCTTASNDDGIISGVDNTMEYRIADSQDEWTSITATSITGLTKGTYEVRIKANGTTLASDAVDITIGEYVAPKVTEPTDTDKEGSNTSKKSEKKESPQTGDTENMYLWLALIMISAGGTLTLVSRKKHEKK